MTPVDRVIAALEAAGCRPHQRGEQWEARCPAHDDHSPSLGVATGHDGRALVKCQAGCDLAAIVAALNIKASDLFPARQTDDRSRITSTYAYTDEASELLFEVVRFEPKDFRQRTPDGSGGWIWKLNGVRRVPYHLPEVLSAVEAGQAVFLTEGEKDADALVAEKYCATTIPGGAGKWRPEYNEHFTGGDVIVVADRDLPGYRHARQVRDELLPVAAKVRVVRSQWGKDASDHLVAGHGVEDFEVIDDELERLCDEMPAVEPAPDTVAIDISGDHLNAQRFIAEHGEFVRWAPQLGRWFEWNGAHWHEDTTEHVQHRATTTIDGLRSWAAEATDRDLFTRRSAHYGASAKGGRRDALLLLARTDPSIIVAVDQLDAHPLLLACRNGTVDLRAGDIRPARQADLLTHGIDVDYDPEARSAAWESFIATTFGGDDDLIGFVQRLLGYCMTGVVHEHVLPVFHGAGANGKSVLTGVVQDLLGDHAMTAPEGLVIRHDHEPHPERIAALRGRRLVVSNELEQRAVLAEQTVKMLTGGDTLSARELYGRRFNFTPSHKVLMVTNHRPKVRGTDHAIWRRIRLVPFETVIAAEDQDVDLRRRLVEDHGPAVLSWLVRGAVEWHREGLGSAPAVDQATERYRQGQDTFGGFLVECTIEVERAQTKVGQLWDVWRRWCERSGDRPGRQGDFTVALEEHGIEIESYQNAKYVRGLGIREFGEGS